MKRPSDAESVKHTCGNCNAQPGEPCTTPTDTGRRAVTWFHYGRLSGAEPATRRSVCTCWRLRPDGTHGKGCDLHVAEPEPGLGGAAAEPFEARYPEHAKLDAVEPESQHAEEMLDWLSENGYFICKLNENDQFIPVYRSSRDLLAERFGIDLRKIQQENRQMLKELSGG